MSPLHRPCLVLLPALLLASQTAPAQEITGVLDSTGMGIYAMEDAVMEAAQETVSRRGKAPPAPMRTTVSMQFAPSSERRRQNLARFVAKSRRADPQGAARLEALFARRDLIGEMGRELAPHGLRTDNVADAYAAWWINAWLASRGRTDTPNRAKVAAVKAQAAQALAQAPGFAQASDAQKQEIADASLVQCALIASAAEGARGDRKQLQALAAAVRQGARRSGLDLDGMELTETGFAPR